MPLKNSQFVRTDKDQYQVHKVITSTEIYGKFYLSQAGFKCHLCKHIQPAALYHNIHISQNNHYCPVCGKKLPQFGRLEKLYVVAYKQKNYQRINIYTYIPACVIK